MKAKNKAKNVEVNKWRGGGFIATCEYGPWSLHAIAPDEKSALEQLYDMVEWKACADPSRDPKDENPSHEGM